MDENIKDTKEILKDILKREVERCGDRMLSLNFKKSDFNNEYVYYRGARDALNSVLFELDSL